MMVLSLVREEKMYYKVPRPPPVYLPFAFIIIIHRIGRSVKIKTGPENKATIKHS